MGKVTCLFNQRPSQRCQCRLLCGREPEGCGFLTPHPSPWLPEPSRKRLPDRNGMGGDLWSTLPVSSRTRWSSKKLRAEVTWIVINKDYPDSKDIISLWNVQNLPSSSQGGPSPCTVCKKEIPRPWECALPEPAVQIFPPSHRLLRAQ